MGPERNSCDFPEENETVPSIDLFFFSFHGGGRRCHIFLQLLCSSWSRHEVSNHRMSQSSKQAGCERSQAFESTQTNIYIYRDQQAEASSVDHRWQDIVCFSLSETSSSNHPVTSGNLTLAVSISLSHSKDRESCDYIQAGVSFTFVLGIKDFCFILSSQILLFNLYRMTLNLLAWRPGND